MKSHVCLSATRGGVISHEADTLKFFKSILQTEYGCFWFSTKTYSKMCPQYENKPDYRYLRISVNLEEYKSVIAIVS